MLIEICQKRGVSPRLVRELLLIESTPPRHGKRGVNVRSREAIEAFAQDPAQLNERISPKGQLPTQLASGPTVWLEEIELKNFAQFEDAGAKFAFNPDRPICLIEANNGHGKSTLIQAVLYVLYGISRARASEMVHHSVKGPRARVEVRLRLRLEGEGEVSITRFSNFERSGQGWSQEESSLTVVSQQGEGEVLHDDIAQDWVKMYLPQEVFSFFCFDAENSPVNSLAEGSAGANIAEALEAVLGITAIRTTAERCRKLGKDWDKEIAANFSHRTPKEVKARQAELEAKKESNGKELEGLRQELQRAIERGARIDSHLESLLHSFDPEQEIERQNSLARLEMVHEQLEAQEASAEHLACTVLPLRLLDEHLEFLLQRGHSARLEQSQEARLGGIREAVEAIADMACRQSIPWKESPLPDRAAVAERLLRQMDLPEGFWAGISRFSLSDGEVRALEKLQEGARHATDLPDWIDTTRALRQEQTALRGRIQPPREQTSHHELMREHRRLMGDKEAALSERVRLEEELRDLGLYGVELQRDDEELVRELKAARGDEKRRKIKELNRSLAFEVGAALDELAVCVRGERVNALESEASLMLRQTTNKPELYDKVSFHRSSLTFQVLDRGGDPVPRPRSTGERTILAMAVVHGLQKASGRLLPMIVEAPLKPLDPDHMAKVVDRFFVHHPGQSLLLFKPEEIPESLRPQLEARVHQWLKIERPQPDRELSVIVDHSRELVQG